MLRLISNVASLLCLENRAARPVEGLFGPLAAFFAICDDPTISVDLFIFLAIARRAKNGSVTLA